MTIKNADKSDVSCLKALWKEGFGDSDEFIEWYFSHRFKCEYTSISKENGKIVSMAYFQPTTLQIRGENIKVAMLNGVYTTPEYRKLGLMHKNVLHLEQISKEHSLPIMINTPSGKNHYHTLGHRYITSCDKRTVFSPNNTRPSLILNILDYCEDTLNVYQAMYKKYSCMICRDINTQKERFSDYAADNAHLLLHYDASELTAYAIVYELEDRYICPECVFTKDEQNILKELSKLGKPCTVKLPSSASPTAVGCITDAKNLLSKFSLPYSVELADNLLRHNNGVFSLDGRFHEPAMKISSCSLLQLLTGYLALDEICDIIIYQENEFRKLNSIFPKQQCYMIEEY